MVMKRLTSAVVSGRRKARLPNVWMNCVAQAAVSWVQGITLALAVALAITAVARASAAFWKPSQAR